MKGAAALPLVPFCRVTPAGPECFISDQDAGMLPMYPGLPEGAITINNEVVSDIRELKSIVGTAECFTCTQACFTKALRWLAHIKP